LVTELANFFSELQILVVIVMNRLSQNVMVLREFPDTISTLALISVMEAFAFRDL
jgi:hypothetical protein